jgi:hypothetical protein
MQLPPLSLGSFMSGLIQSGIQFAQDLAQRFLPPPEPPQAETPEVAAELSAEQAPATEAQVVEAQAEAPQTPQARDAALPKSDVKVNERFSDGAMSGKEMVNFSDGNAVVATQRSQYAFTNVDSAAAYARSLDTPAAVVKEDGRFAVYKLDEQRGAWEIFTPDLSLDEIKPANNSTTPQITRTDDGVAAVTTSDDYVVRFSASGTPQLDTTGSARGPFVAHTEAFGSGLKGLNDQGRFERQFGLAMRDTAFSALDASKQEAESTLGRLQGNTFSAADREAIQRTLPVLEAYDLKIAEQQSVVNQAQLALLGASYSVADAYSLSPVGGYDSYAVQGEAYDRLKAAEGQLQTLQAERTVAAKDAPLLLRVDVQKFKAMSEAEQVAALRSEAQGVVNDIQTTRQNIEDGKINLWMVDGIRNTTAAGLGLEGEQAKWVQDRGAGEKRSDAAWKIAEGVLTVGLAVGGAFFSGGTSLVLLGGAFALGAKGALDITNEYVNNKAAANTNMDPTGGLLPQESVPHVGFVVAAWVGLGLDAAAVSSVVRGMNAGRVTLQQAANTLGTDVKTLQAVMAAGEINTLKTSTMAGQEFVEQFGKSSGEAVTLLRQGENGALQVEVVVRGDLSPAARNAAVREELVHLMQTADPAMSAKLGKLTEQNLSAWNSMSDAQKLDLYQTKLDVELDAQRRLADSATDPASRTRHEGHIEGLQTKLNEVNDAIATGKSPNWLAGAEPPRLFSVRSPLPTASPSATALTDVSGQLTSGKVQGHVYETNFIERAVVSTNGSITLKNGRQVSADGVLALQPDRAGAQITKVEVLNPDGSTLGRTGQVGNVQNAIPYDPANPSTVRISFERTDRTGAVVSDTVEWVTDQALPTGFRVQLQTNGGFMKTGVSGGHTREAWQETTQIYNGVLRESGTPDKVRFSLNGVDNIDASKITYEANRASGWQQVQVPKTIFESTPSMKAFEQHMSPHVANALETNTVDRLVSVSVPVYAKDGKTLTSVMVTVAREPDPSGTGTGQVISWWLSESNFSNALIK